MSSLNEIFTKQTLCAKPRLGQIENQKVLGIWEPTLYINDIEVRTGPASKKWGDSPRNGASALASVAQ